MAEDDRAGARTPLVVKGHHRGDVAVLELRGEVDLATTRTARRAMAARAAEGATVELALTGLDFLDSSGLQFLVTAHKAARADGWTLRIVPPAGGARRALELSALEGVLPLVRRP